MRVSIILIGLGFMVGLPTNVQAVEPDVKCYAAKVKEAAKYSACRLKAESKAIKKGETPALSKCDSNYIKKWSKAESKAAGACPTESDLSLIQARITDVMDKYKKVHNNNGEKTDASMAQLAERSAVNR